MKRILIILFALYALSAFADERNYFTGYDILPLKACNYTKEVGVSSLDDRVAFSRDGQIYVCNSSSSWKASDFLVRKDLQLLNIEGQFSQYYSTLYFSSGGRLCRASLKNGEWGFPEELHIQGYDKEKPVFKGSSFAYRRWIYRKTGLSKESMQNPAIANKGKRLYFVSEMDGGKGGKDIWYMEWDSFSQYWSAPVNASEINTEYDEDYPFVAGDTMFYFSSNRPAKKKKYNIYKYSLEDDQPEVQLLSNGFNSDSDDLNFILAGNVPFFSSDRKGGYDVFCPQKDEEDVLDITVKKHPKVEKKNYNTVVFYFESNNTTMVGNYEYEYSFIYAFINEDPMCKIKIVGYADERGTESSNMTLSRERAKVVYDQLQKMGIKKNRLSYEGMGSANPVVKNAKDEAEHQKNRRVEIIKQK